MVNSKKYLKLENHDYEEIVDIHENIPSVETTFNIHECYWYSKLKVDTVNKWVNKIRQIYYVNKKPKSRVFVGMFVESEPKSIFLYDRNKDLHLLFHLCIGNHCLIHLSMRDSLLPSALSGLLLDGKTVVASANLKSLQETLEKRFGFRLPRTVDLNAEAAVSEGLARDRFDKYGLMKLAKTVLRDEGDLDWDEVLRRLTGGHGTSVSWWQDQHRVLTVEKLRCGTFQAFLAHRMAVNFQAS